MTTTVGRITLSFKKKIGGVVASLPQTGGNILAPPSTQAMAKAEN